MKTERIEKIERIVSDLAAPIVEDQGLELVDVLYVKEAGEWLLRIYVDKPGGVSIDDCTKISEEVGRKLDSLDPIPQSYILEVSSSGEKPLRKEEEFDKYKGRMVAINTFSQIGGRKEFIGHLLGLADGNVRVDVDGLVVDIPKDRISKARLVVEGEVNEP
ncbi:MAG TPA: ribosome maturation factor RimP [Firmicutes bacterium]|nr:ribosome maturation factor RimP [Bacillota bacterium]HHY99167.1 ribosome maturation factor RimP [Bacillota bacterium]